jgi:succinate dehydrogenase/fumarate reductase flavoprotein subunit
MPPPHRSCRGGRHRRCHHAGLVAAVRHTPSITIIEGLEARRLLVADGGIAGVLAAGAQGVRLLASRRIILATGGHWRRDFPHPVQGWARRIVQHLDDAGDRIVSRDVSLPSARQPVASGA